MVQKSPLSGSAGQKPGPKRGRPRAYDEDAALAEAMRVFWTTGYAGTSLDELSAATRMNRPRLYAAFGDKHALYGTLIERYRALARAAMKDTLTPGRPLREGIRAVYDAALAMYLAGTGDARGCFMIGTALTEAGADKAVRASLAAGLREIDDAFEARLRVAPEQGELARSADPAALAKLASAGLYFLAVRSRAGEPRAVLEAAADAAVNLICGPGAVTADTETR